MLAIYFAVGALAAACKDGSQTSTCAQCEMVGTTEVCTECNAGKVPINGLCVDKANAVDKCTKNDGSSQADQTCEKCKGQTFMYKGGCYDKTGDLGQVICKTPGTTPGVCDECQPDYFKNTGNLDTADSCTACADQHCLTCSATTVNKCSVCAEGHFVGAATGSEGPCVKCDATGSSGFVGVAGCAKCTRPNTSGASGTATCDECVDGNYLKTTDTGTLCIEKTQYVNDYFPTADENKNVCVKCSEVPKGGIAECSTCVPKASTARESVIIACSSCTGDKKVSPGQNSCIAECPANSAPDTNSVCVCNSGLTPNEAGTSCVSASGGPNLSTGAIAGISVAAVVVVGGLVGFLCWWFVCRGKA
ncbi:Variant-specific surface protein [Giardia duodenalis]|uniref:Variant-specific surface protein n=1 Tax=Giardia intestinalis TaxID=5741 RepID=V6U2X5_GIAIN|nr:Variant-specific surface protein [Giardia intestinalis]